MYLTAPTNAMCRTANDMDVDTDIGIHYYKNGLQTCRKQFGFGTSKAFSLSHYR